MNRSGLESPSDPFLIVLGILSSSPSSSFVGRWCEHHNLAFRATMGCTDTEIDRLRWWVARWLGEKQKGLNIEPWKHCPLDLGFDVFTRTSSHELLASFKKSLLGKGPSNQVFSLHYPDEHFKVDPPPLDNVEWLNGYSWSLPSLFGLFFH